MTSRAGGIFGIMVGGGDQNIKKKLDMAVCSPSWRLAFPRATLKHRICSKSDHIPIHFDIQFGKIVVLSLLDFLFTVAKK